jgi:hypothetical protein
MTYRVLSHRDLLKAEDIMNALAEDGPFVAQAATRSNLGVQKLF